MASKGGLLPSASMRAAGLLPKGNGVEWRLQPCELGAETRKVPLALSPLKSWAASPG